MWKKILWENLEMVLIALLIVLPVRYFLIQPFIVHGSSMEPNFFTQDYLIIDELSYRFRPPQRYEVVVLKAPNHPNQYYIKRIIGLPNETVEIHNGEVSIIDTSGKKITLQENFLAPNTVTSGNLTIALNSQQYFALGDNRVASYDSRNWGPFTKDLIIGRVWLRLWPFNRLAIFNVPHNAYAQ
ncbi:MAG: signal peptidase I [Parcubacteria group bacterium]|nr:signal peptidase I [Parcubacteria group bacterium]